MFTISAIDAPRREISQKSWHVLSKSFFTSRRGASAMFVRCQKFREHSGSVTKCGAPVLQSRKGVRASAAPAWSSNQRCRALPACSTQSPLGSSQNRPAPAHASQSAQEPVSAPWRTSVHLQVPAWEALQSDDELSRTHKNNKPALRQQTQKGRKCRIYCISASPRFSNTL